MHLAAACGTSCVALFGNFNLPQQWFPYGPDHRVIYEAEGVRKISVERVADTVESAIHALRDSSVREQHRVAGAAGH
jgi:heptosyltransferase III